MKESIKVNSKTVKIVFDLLDDETVNENQKTVYEQIISGAEKFAELAEAAVKKTGELSNKDLIPEAFYICRNSDSSADHEFGILYKREPRDEQHLCVLFNNKVVETVGYDNLVL